MFEYKILMPFPLKPVGEAATLQSSVTVATFNYDLGLQEKEEFLLEGLSYGGWEDKPFNFTAVMSKKRKIVKPHKDGDLFIIEVYIDVAEKEELIRFKEIWRRLNPGAFEED